MVRLTRGEELAGNVEPEAYYLEKRSPAVLKEIGAADDTEFAVMNRADRIGRGNKDGSTQATELRDLWSPEVARTLLPRERHALTNIWEKYRIEHPDFTPLDVGDLSAESFHEIPARLGEIDFGACVEIEALPEALREVAMRVYLAANVDGASPSDRESPTISYRQITESLRPAELRNFTDDEASLIREIEAVIAPEAREPMAPPRLVVPSVGRHSIIAAAVGGAVATFEFETKLLLSRAHQSGNDQVAALLNRLEYSRSSIGLQLDVPPGHRLILISEQGEAIYEGQSLVDARPGSYLVEVYNADGQKLGDESFTVPNVAGKIDLARDHLGKGVETTEGRPLFAGLTSYVTANQQRAVVAQKYVYPVAHDAKWTYSAETPIENEALAEAARRAFSWPESKLYDGVYAFRPRPVAARADPAILDVVFEKHPGPVIFLEIHGDRLPLTPNVPQPGQANSGGWEIPTYRYRGPRGEVTFDPTKDTLHIRYIDAQGADSSWSHSVVLGDGVFEPRRAPIDI